MTVNIAYAIVTQPVIFLIYLTHRWVSLDMAEAFDQKQHKALLAKLPSYEFPKFFPEDMLVSAGVPQGCVLSPTLFLIYIAVQMIAQWMIYTPAAQVLLRKTSASVKINLCLLQRHPMEMFPSFLLGERNLLQFIPKKAQVSALTTNKNPSVVSCHQFSRTRLIAAPSISTQSSTNCTEVDVKLILI